MPNQRNMENFCLSEAAESSLEVSAHSSQLLESTAMSNQRNLENFCPPTQVSCWESSNNVKPKK